MIQFEPKSIADFQEEVNGIDHRYTLEKIIGNGSYGMVIKAFDSVNECYVALKRINKEIFCEPVLALRILREIKLLSHFRDENIVRIRNILTPARNDFNEFYLVMDIMETDLKKVFKSQQKLTDPHIQFFLYQCLRALKVIHDSGVIHRDITPANILVNINCDLKICDFGLARESADEDQTDYVTMRWYRAPELVMEHKNYTNQVDMWGVGCILAELLGSRPMFPGKDRVNQLDKIIDIVGTPTEEELLNFGSPAAQEYVRRKEFRSASDFKDLFPDANPLAVDLLKGLLKFHPDKRMTAQQAISHPYLAELRDDEAESVDIHIFNHDESNLKTMNEIKAAIIQECVAFHQKFPETNPCTSDE
ncbi:mitogen activated protein kinase [Perkinsela sp. CCAP 1560/4]|nr:mitogen activated protein kinase [Perkinsela sp. CCAP 1560/4]|eukprot:KNH09420.1 mitogen activated protein kinase [Perkinsela sp. CCAP 1560/4]